MEANDFERTLAVYEAGYDSIESVLDDDSLGARDKVDAIADIVYGEDDDDDADD